MGRHSDTAVQAPPADLPTPKRLFWFIVAAAIWFALVVPTGVLAWRAVAQQPRQISYFAFLVAEEVSVVNEA